MKFGYARVSTKDQNLERQINALISAGVEEENIFAEKVSGVKAKADKPALDDLFSRLRSGDELYILSLDRLARSTKQLLCLVEELETKGVQLISLKENIDTSTPQGKLIFSIFASIAEFQRAIIKENQAEGIAIAKSKNKMGRPKVDESKINSAISLYKSNEHTVREIESIIGISRGTLYKELKRRGISRK